MDFWAPWCGPCRVLTPILEGLAREYEGKFTLATVNTDQNPQLAFDYNIRTIPTVILFYEGKPAEEFLGVQPEPVIRALLERYIERDSDRMRKTAAQALEKGDTETATRLLGEALAADPGNERIHPDLARLFIAQRRYDEAENVLDQLPPLRQQDEDILALGIRIKYGRIASAAPDEEVLLKEKLAQDPNNAEARYQLSARQIMRGDFEAALENLLEILRQDRSFGDDGARKAVIDIFALLGGEGPLVKRYRPLLAAALH